MLQHQTEIELTAEPTHDGTNEIIAAVIDKLGELTHGCAIITGCFRPSSKVRTVSSLWTLPRKRTSSTK